MGRTSVFSYSNPGVIHWGRGSVAQLSAELQRLEVLRLALVTTRSLLGELERLPAKPVVTIVISQHAPMSQIDAGVEEASSAGADGVVSFGGGSAIDAAKIVSVRLADGGGRRPPHLPSPTNPPPAEAAAG